MLHSHGTAHVGTPQLGSGSELRAVAVDNLQESKGFTQGFERVV